MQVQKGKTDWGQRIETIIMVTFGMVLILAVIIIFIPLLPIILLIELSKGEEEPIDEAVWYQSGGRGTIF